MTEQPQPEETPTPQPEPGEPATGPTTGGDSPPQASGKLRGRGTAIGAGEIAAMLRRRAEEAGPSLRAVSEQARRTAQELSERAQHAAEAARPEAERLAKQAKAAADAARPHVEQAAHRAADYITSHEDELRNAATGAGKTIARGMVPPALRPAVNAFEHGLRDDPSARQPSPPSAPEDASPAEGDQPR